MSTIKAYAEAEYDSVLQALRELCAIPAPSNHEERRAEYLKRYLDKLGADGVYIDEALNVVFPLNCDGKDAITVFVAHTDTVFPDADPLPYSEDEDCIRCPGVGDDTASVAVLMSVIRYYLTKRIVPANGALFVLNSGEEGLGNLKGTRQIFKDYEGRIAQFISFDGLLNELNDACAGSHRYAVTVRTEGGHSFQKFGNTNALVELAKIITAIDAIEMPNKPNTRTTHNIGTVSGGTSVNTIAQEATMLCEYRSTDAECLDAMEQAFMSIFEAARTDRVDVQVTKVGDRPCSRIEEDCEAAFRDRLLPKLQALIGPSLICKSASTDCNIPLSLGIPALCIGTYYGGGAHTREEWLDKKSLITGTEVALTVALTLTNEEELSHV